MALPFPLAEPTGWRKMMIRDGHVRHAWLGVAIGDVKDGAKLGQDGEPDQKDHTSKSGPARAAWVNQVLPNGPASQAGVHVGDVVTHIDKQKIEGAADVVDYVSGQKVGDKVKLALLRDGRSTTVQVTLGELPARPGEEPDAQVEKDKIGVHCRS